MNPQYHQQGYRVAKPELLEGWEGEIRPHFRNLGLSCRSHTKSEFALQDGSNECTITLNTDRPVQVIGKLKLVTGRTSKGEPSVKEMPQDSVLVQRRDRNQIAFHLGFSEKGWYQFMIHAVDEKDNTDNFPNVFNYIIYAEPYGYAAEPFPKQFTRCYDEDCCLEEPLHLSPSSNKGRVKFSLVAPRAMEVYLFSGNDLLKEFTKHGNQWQLVEDLSGIRGKLTIYAYFGDAGDKVHALWEYIL